MARFSLSSRQRDALAQIAERWGVDSLEVFGSALDDRFGPESDVDLLVSFRPGVRVSLFDLAGIEMELETIVGRPVDLVLRGDVERSHNPIRKASILTSARPLYPAGA